MNETDHNISASFRNNNHGYHCDQGKIKIRIRKENPAVKAEGFFKSVKGLETPKKLLNELSAGTGTNK